MPKNNNVVVEQMHTTLKFGESGHLEFVEQLNNIDVKIVGAPSVAEFRKTISVFMMNTWNDHLHFEFSEEAIDQCIKDLFAGKILPTGMETIGVTWSVSGLNLIDTTHLIRHRLFSFSAQTHADRDMRDDMCVVTPGIMANEDFYDRYQSIVRNAHQLYIDMMDSGRVNCLDARTIMPRCMDHFYVTRCCIKDLVSYCQMRADEQIQTTVDNIVAMKLWLEILKLYPFLKGLVDFNKPDTYYVSQCSAGKTNIFPPNKKNDLFEWTDEQFVHTIHRDDFPGGDVYLKLKAELLAQIDAI
jgi:thymidylate synthase (FAD)